MTRDKNKPYIRLGLIGAEKSGKTSLISAITRVLSLQDQAIFRSVEALENFDPGERNCFGPNIPYVEVVTGRFNLMLLDYISPQLATHLLIKDYGALHGLILLVSLPQGITAQTETLVSLAERLQIPIVAVFLGRSDLASDSTFEENISNNKSEL